MGTVARVLQGGGYFFGTWGLGVGVSLQRLDLRGAEIWRSALRTCLWTPVTSGGLCPGQGCTPNLVEDPRLQGGPHPSGPKISGKHQTSVMGITPQQSEHDLCSPGHWCSVL